MVKCYSKRTLIVHKNGVKTIEGTNAGDYILTNEGYKLVTNKFYRQTNEKDTVEMVYNTPMGAFHLTSTRGAKLMTSTGSRRVDHTRGSDKIYVLDLKGNKVETHIETAWCLVREPDRMYNLELEDGSSFYANGILVKSAQYGE